MKAESKFGRIKVEEKKMSLNVVFDDLGRYDDGIQITNTISWCYLISDLGAGISGTLIESDGQPFTVEPCNKNTDNERQFHRLISWVFFTIIKY